MLLGNLECATHTLTPRLGVSHWGEQTCPLADLRGVGRDGSVSQDEHRKAVELRCDILNIQEIARVQRVASKNHFWRKTLFNEFGLCGGEGE